MKGYLSGQTFLELLTNNSATHARKGSGDNSGIFIFFQALNNSHGLELIAKSQKFIIMDLNIEIFSCENSSSSK